MGSWNAGGLGRPLPEFPCPEGPKYTRNRDMWGFYIYTHMCRIYIYIYMHTDILEIVAMVLGRYLTLSYLDP